MSRWKSGATQGELRRKAVLFATVNPLSFTLYISPLRRGVRQPDAPVFSCFVMMVAYDFRCSSHRGSRFHRPTTRAAVSSAVGLTVRGLVTLGRSFPPFPLLQPGTGGFLCVGGWTICVRL